MTPLDRDRLAKILAMLSSPHPGEALAAAEAAHKFVNAAGISWNELLAGKEMDDHGELLKAKMNALSASNHRLRLENEALRRAGPGGTNHPSLHAWVLWTAFMICIGLFLLYVIEQPSDGGGGLTATPRPTRAMHGLDRDR
jgi:hypothetical protein